MFVAHAKQFQTTASIALLAPLLLLSGCSQQPGVESIAEWPHYATVQEANAESDLVVVGTVLDSSDNGWDPAVEFARTISSVKIAEVLAGDASAGDTIQVTQMGGIRNGTEYSEAATVLLRDIATEELVLFLYKHDDGYSTINPSAGVQVVIDDSELLGVEPAAKPKRYATVSAPFPEADSLDELRTELNKTSE